jgi:hypothetical protein
MFVDGKVSKMDRSEEVLLKYFGAAADRVNLAVNDLG